MVNVRRTREISARRDHRLAHFRNATTEQPSLRTGNTAVASGSRSVPPPGMGQQAPNRSRITEVPTEFAGSSGTTGTTRPPSRDLPRNTKRVDTRSGGRKQGDRNDISDISDLSSLSQRNEGSGGYSPRDDERNRFDPFHGSGQLKDPKDDHGRRGDHTRDDEGFGRGRRGDRTRHDDDGYGFDHMQGGRGRGGGGRRDFRDDDDYRDPRDRYDRPRDGYGRGGVQLDDYRDPRDHARDRYDHRPRDYRDYRDYERFGRGGGGGQRSYSSDGYYFQQQVEEAAELLVQQKQMASYMAQQQENAKRWAQRQQAQLMASYMAQQQQEGNNQHNRPGGSFMGLPPFFPPP